MKNKEKNNMSISELFRTANEIDQRFVDKKFEAFDILLEYRLAVGDLVLAISKAHKSLIEENKRLIEENKRLTELQDQTVQVVDKLTNILEVNNIKYLIDE